MPSETYKKWEKVLDGMDARYAVLTADMDRRHERMDKYYPLFLTLCLASLLSFPLAGILPLTLFLIWIVSYLITVTLFAKFLLK